MSTPTARVADRRLTVDDLSPDQREVYESIWNWSTGIDMEIGANTGILTCGGFGGTGKGQPLDAVVMTPFGPKRMGDLQIGSQVSNPDGSVAKVLFVHELGVRNTFRVSFSDGGSTLVTEDHLWLTKRAGKPKYKAERRDMNGAFIWGRLETTKQLVDYVETQKGDRRKYMPLVPLTFPVAFTINNMHRKEPIDPYVLGVLIGDGGMTTHQIVLTSADLQIVQRVERTLKTHFTSSDGLGYRIPVRTGVRDGLVELGLYGKHSHKKFIPPDYKYGPADTRWEIIRGLLDTDGTVGRNNLVSFTSASEQLADDVQWVLGSLGYRATKTSRIPTYRDKDGEKKRGRRAYTLHVQGRNTASLFHLTRKKRRCAVFNGGVSEVARRMVSIEPAGRTTCRCITVDHPNGLYITDDFIVTHNSSILGVFASMTPLQVAYVSYTGRAASVLGRKLKACGAVTTDKTFTNSQRILEGRFGHLFSEDATASFCGTLHRLLYRPMVNEKTDELLGWSRREALDRQYDLIVVDEASMISDEILIDLKGHGIPILAVGDHGQLPPVAASGDLMQNPMLRLEKIHRQALGNPIIALSKVIRETGKLDKSLADGKRIRFASKSDLPLVLEAAYHRDKPLDVGVLCWTNKVRVRLNGAARKAQGFNGPPRKGEVVICLRNKPPVYNGMRGLLVKDAVEWDSKGGSNFGLQPWHLQARIEFADEGIDANDYTLCAPQFMRETSFKDLEELNARGIQIERVSDAGFLADFGYAMTVHKAQGSAFDHVIVFLDRPQKPWDDEYKRWLYTGATRASDRLTILL